MTHNCFVPFQDCICSPQASALRTHTESTLRGNSPSERYSQAIANARANTSGKQSASKVLNEGMLLEALGPKVGCTFLEPQKT